MKKIVSILMLISMILVFGNSVFANEFKPGISKIEITQNNITINNIKYDNSYKNGKLESLVKKYCYEGSILPLREVVQIANEINQLIKED